MRSRSSSDPNPNAGNGKPESSNGEKQYGGSPLKPALIPIEEQENTHEHEDEDEYDNVLVVRSDDEEQDTNIRKSTSPQKRQKRSVWDEIDAWDMDFEEVEVWERSSEKNAR
jgi:hypothetical protein